MFVCLLNSNSKLKCMSMKLFSSTIQIQINLQKEWSTFCIIYIAGKNRWKDVTTGYYQVRERHTDVAGTWQLDTDTELNKSSYVNFFLFFVYILLLLFFFLFLCVITCRLCLLFVTCLQQIQQSFYILLWKRQRTITRLFPTITDSMGSNVWFQNETLSVPF